METTFITIHDLSPEARILYSSDSIVDILGHTPDEVLNRSCWNFFHPDEIPYAQEFHKRGVTLDKAAVLAYCQIKNRNGQWVGCECCFTVVYDVMVVCTSIYRRGMTSQKRAVEAPIVRKLFSSSPKDPRYHMLSHLSTKFNQAAKQQTHEPRAALFLNRFTRTLTIMYATSGIEQIIGISGDEMKGRSFYYCIQENCLEDAVRVLETAKGNDSIAYLRFWFRDPRQDDAARAQPDTSEDDSADESMTDATSLEDEDEGGVQLEGHETSHSAEGGTSNSRTSDEISPTDSRQRSSTNSMDIDRPTNSDEQPASRGSSRDSVNATGTHAAIFGHPTRARSSTSSVPPLSPNGRSDNGYQPIELEAVVSCTSDGLVVCLRRARPIIPPSAQPQAPAAQPVYANGLFAAPWAPEPMYLPPLPQLPPQHYGAPPVAQTGFNMHQQQPRLFPGGPIQQDFMRSIQEVAVFAWALTGINGSLAEYSRGKPIGESIPPDGFPVWVPPDRSGNRSGDGSSAYGSSGSRSTTLPDPVSTGGGGPSPSTKLPFGDPGLGNGNGNGGGGGGGAHNGRSGGLKHFFQW
ncbi:hypothetical protein H2201_000189 [Coniosporium apollinis]|uniref:PAS domain-containing protein n=2 Tax=Coniosporium TaxID=2810619 RepID=A0ABQ9PAB2_9PEZI|nr:hypothetical protein H2199_008168 [Cladosporium sp. JES 115]KAJ9669803.1 hypothetical protein H2201_000189 [Coniosporium apollinis]